MLFADPTARCIYPRGEQKISARHPLPPVWDTLSGSGSWFNGFEQTFLPCRRCPLYLVSYESYGGTGDTIISIISPIS